MLQNAKEVKKALSRIIHTDSPARTRKKLLQALAAAWCFHQQEEISQTQQLDLCAFALLTLSALLQSADRSATAWENRDYWLKADRMRNEWAWASQIHAQILTALEANDIPAARNHLDSMTTHVESITFSKTLLRSKLWQGAYKKWKSQS